MPIIGADKKAEQNFPGSGFRDTRDSVKYTPPGSEKPSDRKGRKSDPVPPEIHHEPGISVYHDSETDVELLLAKDGQSLTIRVGTDRLELSGREWRGLYSGVLNIGPGRDSAP